MAKFEKAAIEILQREGGYQNDPNDYGNYNSLGQLVGTKYGISAKMYEQAFPGYYELPSVDTMQSLTTDIAYEIYRSQFWIPYGFENINDQSVANQVFDIFFNHSPNTAATIIQKAIVQTGVPISVDGVYGNQTKSAINQLISLGLTAELNNNMVLYRKAYFDDRILQDPTQEVFHDGWINRTESYLLPTFTGSQSRLAIGGLFVVIGLIAFYSYKK